VSNILSFVSGVPFNITASSASLNAPGSSQRAQVKEKVAILGGVGPGQPYFDTSAFAPVDEPRFGDPAKEDGTSACFVNFTLPSRSSVDVQFRAEAFNFTNTANFSNPDGNASSSSFGDITSAPGEREFRFGLRIGF
jgi:hypothetical protein